MEQIPSNVASPDLATHVRSMERRRLEALCAADVPACEVLHAADYQLITPGGAALSRDEYLGQIAEGVLVYSRFEPDGDIAVRVLGLEAAAVRYVAVIDAAFPGGRDRDRFWHTDLYQVREGRWQAVWSQATRISAR